MLLGLYWWWNILVISAVTHSWSFCITKSMAFCCLRVVFFFFKIIKLWLKCKRFYPCLAYLWKLYCLHYLINSFHYALSLTFFANRKWWESKIAFINCKYFVNGYTLIRFYCIYINFAVERLESNHFMTKVMKYLLFLFVDKFKNT